MIDKITRMRKNREAAALLPLLGVVLFATPVVTIFTSNLQEGGLLRATAYIFGTWLVLIVLAAVLAKRLSDHKKPD